MNKTNQPACRVALLGQPNTGKSTLFNKLTGLHQHVGNWPGKTVARRAGRFSYKGDEYELVDLPGTYSLSPGSEEEKISRDYLLSGQTDVVVLVVDASQFERSLYLLSEYLGIELPLVIALNMIDVAHDKGMSIDHDRIARELGCPIIPTAAAYGNGLEALQDAIAEARKRRDIPDASPLHALYEADEKLPFRDIHTVFQNVDHLTSAPPWLTEKVLAGDTHIRQAVEKRLTDSDCAELDTALKACPADFAKVRLANHKYAWISRLTHGAVNNTEEEYRLKGFDRIALHPFFGKFLAVFFIFLGMLCSFLMISPLFFISGHLPALNPVMTAYLQSLGAPHIVVSFFSDALVPALVVTFVLVVSICGFVFMISILEDIGYLARIAFIFDRAMSRLGMHGKSFMPLLMGLSCSIAAVTGGRVIDSWKQRTLTVIVSLVMPCLAVWGVISLLTGIFFGEHFWLVLLALFTAGALHVFVTAKLFGNFLGIDSTEPGLVMELPPYHKPNFATIFSRVLQSARGIMTKSMVLLVSVSLLIWALSYSEDGNIQNTLIYSAGKFIEPFGLFFGMDWRLFITLILSGVRKEAALGVIAILFGAGSGNYTDIIGGGLHYDMGNLSQAVIGPDGTTAAMALAFMFAFFLNVPCLGAIAAIHGETNSLKWTTITVVYYLAMAMLVSGVVFRLANHFL